MTEIGIFVPNNTIRWGKSAYYDKLDWTGISIIRDILIRAGYNVGYCSSSTVKEHRIILVSIISALGWLDFLRERLTWDRGEYKTIIGGAGVTNIRAVLPFGDIFVLGRAEEFICDLVDFVLSNDYFEHESVIYAENFSINKKYKIAQIGIPYTDDVILPNGFVFNERAVGCQNKCLFCGYTWHRKNVGGMQSATGSMGQRRNNISSESTLMELDIENPSSWLDTGFNVIGLDGTSERLRMMVNKRITDDRLVKFLIGLEQLNKITRIYNIVGYPTETEKDYLSLIDIFDFIDNNARSKYGIKMHMTAFRAVPATPAAIWPMAYFDYRRAITEIFRDLCSQNGAYFEGGYDAYKGRKFWVQFEKTIEGLPTVILESLILRGIEKDAEILTRLARSKRYRVASNYQKQVTLEKYVDVDRLFRAYTWDDLPSRYLEGYLSNSALAKIGDHHLHKYGCESNGG